MGDVSADLSQLRLEMALTDKEFAAALKKEIRAAVNEAGKAIVDEVKKEASWSTRIPGATSLGVSFSARTAGVTVKTSAAKAPDARPLESGNGGGVNRHPVFGGPAWVNQPTRPFFFKSVSAMTPATEARMVEAIDAVCIESGFRSV